MEITYNLSISSNEFMSYYIRDMFGIQNEQTRRYIVACGLLSLAIAGAVFAPLFGVMASDTPRRKALIYGWGVLQIIVQLLFAIAPAFADERDVKMVLIPVCVLEGIATTMHYGPTMSFGYSLMPAHCGNAETISAISIAAVLGLMIGVWVNGMILQVFSSEIFSHVDKALRGAIFGQDSLNGSYKVRPPDQVVASYNKILSSNSTSTIELFTGSHLFARSDADAEGHYSYFAYLMTVAFAIGMVLVNMMITSKVHVDDSYNERRLKRI